MTEFWFQFSIMIAVVAYVAITVLPELWNEIKQHFGDAE
jgi:hypothetical protein